MNKRVKSITKYGIPAIALILIAIFVLSSILIKDNTSDKPVLNCGFSPYKFDSTHSDYELEFFENTASFSVKSGDKVVWSNEITSEKRTELTQNKEWDYYLRSLVTVNYYNSTRTGVDVKKVHSSSEDANVKCSKSANGCIYEIYFKKIGIGISVEISLIGNAVSVKIPASGIFENSFNKVVSVEILPFFGASDSNDDGYILYPDGCGALMYSDKQIEKPSTQILEIYGSSELQNSQQIAASATLPVFGIKKGKNAFLAVATSGEADSVINITPAGYVVNVNRASFEMKYRYYYNVPASDLVTGNSSQRSVTKLDSNRIDQDFEAVYMMLNGDNSDYNGMARAYRNFLNQNGKLKNSVKKLSAYPISLGILTGITENDVVGNISCITTDFDKSENIVSDLLKEGVTFLDVTLFGWNDGGFGVNNKSSSVWTAAGGKKSLAAFAKSLKSKNINLLLNKDLIRVNSDDSGFVSSKMAVKSGNGFVLTDSNKFDFLLNSTAQNDFYKAFKKTSDYLECGGYFASVAELLVSDYSASTRCTRTKYMMKISEILSQYSKDSPLCCSTGNGYSLQYADRLAEIPDDSSKLAIMSEEIPFYQMIVHGNIEYTGRVQNLSHDDIQLLHLIEYGYTPYFELTSEGSSKLKYSSADSLFSSKYEYLKENIIEVSKKVSSLNEIRLSPMVSHNHQYGLSIVEYENGYKLYVNYTDSEITVKDTQIAPYDFELIK